MIPNAINFTNPKLFHFLLGAFIVFLTYEVFLWAVVLNRHATWMHQKQFAGDVPACFFVDGWFRLYTASVLAVVLSLIALFWEIYILLLILSGSLPHSTYAPIIVAGLQLNSIHFFALISRCACIDPEEWPPASRWKARILNIDAGTVAGRQHKKYSALQWLQGMGAVALGFFSKFKIWRSR